MKRLYNYFSDLYKKTASKKWINKLVFIALGISSTAWFLMRVIPKPTRATYPCMQAASPFMSAFIIYLLSLWGGLKSFNKYKQLIHQRKTGWAAICLLAVFACIFVFSSNNIKTVFANPSEVQASTFMTGPNQPVGEGKGIFPGRVTWAHIPGTASWERQGSWFAEQYTNQENCDEMMRQTILTLTGENTVKAAWNALFIHFNKEKRGLTRSFNAGEKIAIKINNNNAQQSQADGTVRGLNTSPHMILALLRSLIYEAEIPQAQITVCDPSRYINDFLYNKCTDEFPNVKYVDKSGGNGRIQAVFVNNSITYTQSGNDRALASCVIEADYLINFAIPKLHGIAGVTLCGKNWVGVPRGVAHYQFTPPSSGVSQYMAFTDNIANKELGGKTLLFFIDALYGTNNVDGPPSGKWKTFNNEWPCSLWASQDPVAIDAVGMDFLAAEWNYMNYADMYLHEAALIGNAPSGVKYHDGSGIPLTKSQGVLEHWNNATDKEYSRNLGKDYGIELVRTVAGPIIPVPVTGVALNKNTTTIAVNSTEQLTNTIQPGNATNKKVTWSSSNNNIATVSDKGLVTAIAAGTATITVTTEDGNKTAQCVVTASLVAVTGVSLKSAATIGIYGTEQLTPTFQPENASNKNVTWNSDNTTVATVNTNGVVSAKAVGTATITVTTADGNKTAACLVTVTPQPPVPPGTNLALNKLVEYVGGVEGGYVASNITDGNRNSRWASAQGEDNKVVTIDLQDTYSLFEIVLYWEAAYASEFNIQVSTDGNDWTTVQNNTSGKSGEQKIAIDNVNARYVRINCIKRVTAYGFSLYEVEVFGDVAHPTGIQKQQTTFKVYPISGGLAVEGVEKATVYGIAGNFIVTAKGGNIALPQGAYIVKVGNKAVKVIVK